MKRKPVERDRRCTLLMAYCAAEHLGLKTKGQGAPPKIPKGFHLENLSGTVGKA